MSFQPCAKSMLILYSVILCSKVAVLQHIYATPPIEIERVYLSYNVSTSLL